MPKLSSGRCVGVDPVSLRPLLSTGNEAQALWVISAFRLKIHKPADLRQMCRVVYYDEASGNTPIEEFSNSGLTVLDLESGSSDWTHLEVEEFVSWMNNNRALNSWLEAEYKAMVEEVKAHPLWTSDFMLKE